MTTKSDFTPEEWRQLQVAAVYAGMAVIVGDVSLTNMFKELIHMAKAVEAEAIPAGAEELVGNLIANMKAEAENKEGSKKSLFDSSEAKKFDSPDDMVRFAYGQVAEAAAIVEAKAGAMEARGYKQWVLGIAQATAEAGREGGFLGIGAVRLSDQEKAILAALTEILRP